MGGDFTTIQWLQAANQNHGLEAGESFNFVNGCLNCEGKIVDMTTKLKLATLYGRGGMAYPCMCRFSATRSSP